MDIERLNILIEQHYYGPEGGEESYLLVHETTNEEEMEPYELDDYDGVELDLPRNIDYLTELVINNESSTIINVDLDQLRLSNRLETLELYGPININGVLPPNLSKLEIVNGSTSNI